MNTLNQIKQELVKENSNLYEVSLKETSIVKKVKVDDIEKVKKHLKEKYSITVRVRYRGKRDINQTLISAYHSSRNYTDCKKENAQYASLYIVK